MFSWASGILRGDSLRLTALFRESLMCLPILRVCSDFITFTISLNVSAPTDLYNGFLFTLYNDIFG